MKKLKRKTPIKCPECKNIVIGHKHPTDDPLFSSLVKMNEHTSQKSIEWNGGIHMYCLSCESEIRKKKRELRNMK